MESSEIEALIECLVANPHDADALARAHRQGEADPQGYAYLLEQVGTRTEDPAYASHWLSEAANIWSFTLGDAHRAARVLMIAVDKDPTQPLAADRLAQLYRDKGDVKALVAMLDRRVRLLTPMLASNPAAGETLRALIATLHEELGKLWNEAPLEQPRKAIDHYKRAIELDPTSAFAIFSVREIYKSLQQWDDAIALYGMEMALERDPERRLMLARDDAATRRLAGDLGGVTRVLRGALDEVRASGVDDPILVQEVASSILDRTEARAPVDERERSYGADLLAGLAESFDGQHGLAYAAGALDLVPGHDRALQLYVYYGAATGLAPDALTLKYHAYLEANPGGPFAQDARLHLAASYEALGQIAQAVQVLAPLEGRPEVDARLASLRRLHTNTTPTPVAGVEDVARAGVQAGQTREDRAQLTEPVDTDEVADITGAGTGSKGTRVSAVASAQSAESARLAALDAARTCVAKSDKSGALEQYLVVLAADPVEPEALSWVEDTLRSKRDYAKLRDVLWASARAMGSQDSIESRKLRLREIAGLSESNLKDVDGAIQAWRQVLSLDRGDDTARQALTRALEKSQRWDDLANLFEQEASTTPDVDAKIQLEKKLVALHEQKRSDPLAAAEAWTRIANLTPDDDHPVVMAADLFQKAERPELAVTVIEEHVDAVSAVPARAALLERLGGLLVGSDRAAAGRAYQRAAEAESTLPRWALAETSYAAAEVWPLAASAAQRTGDLTKAETPDTAAEALARAATYLERAGEPVRAIALLERAHALASSVDSYAVRLIDTYRAGGDLLTLARFLVARAEGHADGTVRVAAAREAAKIYDAAPLSDVAAARAQWTLVLAAGEDAEALERLVDIAEGRSELDAAAALLARLGALATTPEAKTAAALREAALLARAPESVGAAVDRYEWVLSTLDAKNRVALRAIADLELQRGAPKAAANALERELAVADDAAARREIGGRLVAAYEAAGDDAGTFDALTALREADADDFDALNRLVGLAEKLERWSALVDLLAIQIEVEADENEISALTRRRATLLADKMGKGDEALAAMQELADAGDTATREAYVELGDRLGWRGIVATKLVDWWFPEPGSEERTRALTGAFERFAIVGRDSDAVRVGIEILRGSRSVKLAEQLEALAVKTSDDVGLTAAQEILGLELSGAARAAELVRQAEMRVQAKMASAESVQHGETGLGGLTHDEVGPLLARLAALVADHGAAIDLYERQVSRSRGGEAREKALIRAAQIAGEHGDLVRARTFFDLALSGTPTDATLDALASAATEPGSADAVKRTLAEAFAHGGEGVRDGGRSRASFLRRAARIAHVDLHDEDQAFAWLSDALIAHADTATLDALVALAEEAKTPKRVDDVLTRVLTEVFDGPLVRLLLARRAKLRKDVLGDRSGAAADLKKLHDLSPTDEAVMAELAALLTEQGDHRSMVQLYEDQILRSKDQTVRAELGRKVAQIWESELADAREAADAWRRVLRLKPGDEEATQGLDRAKTNMLRKAPAVVAPPASGSATSLTQGPLSPTPDTRMSTDAARPQSAATAKGTLVASAVASVPVAAAVATVAVTRGEGGEGGDRSETTPSEPALKAAEPTLAPPTATRTAVEPAARLVLVPADEDSVQEVDDLELEYGSRTTENRAASELPQLEQLLGSTDPFGEADTTHTSIDVRLPLAAARALDSSPAPVGPNSGPMSPISSRRGSKPPPLPPPSSAPASSAPTPYEQNDPPTAPGRRMDVVLPRVPSTDRALAMTDQNPPVDFAEHTVADTSGKDALAGLERHREIPPDILSATDLALDDDEDDDVLVVDEFVEDNDEYEDIVEPSKPSGPPH